MTPRILNAFEQHGCTLTHRFNVCVSAHIELNNSRSNMAQRNEVINVVAIGICTRKEFAVFVSATPYSNSHAAFPPPRPPRSHSAPSLHWTIEVLVVEDDEADRSLITDVLKRNPNVSAIHATDAPDQALVDLERGRLRPNLILLDINMPRLNGFQFLEGLRHIPSMQETDVVVLTTSALARDVKEACTNGVNLYIIKPDSHAELKSRLGTVVDQARTGTWGA